MHKLNNTAPGSADLIETMMEKIARKSNRIPCNLFVVWFNCARYYVIGLKFTVTIQFINLGDQICLWRGQALNKIFYDFLKFTR